MTHEIPDDCGRSLTDWKASFETPWYSMLTRKDWHIVTPTVRRNGASVLVVDSLDRALLLEVYRPAIDEVCLETPRGMSDPGETTREVAARELAEETGLSCPPSDLLRLGEVYPDTGILAHRLALYALRLDAPFPEIQVDPDEALGHRLIPISQLEKMVAAGLVPDAITAVSLARFKHEGLHAQDGMAGIEKEIEICNAEGDVVISMRARRPDWAFEKYCRDFGGNGLSWRFARPD